MKKQIKFAMLILAFSAIIAAPALAQDKKAAPRPGEPGFPAYVLDRVDDVYRGRKSRGVMAMTIQTKHWKRGLEMESWSLGKDYSLVRIKKPRKERGTATLKAKKDLFIYLNKTGRTIKISSGMLGGSWMGSHFTNDDLIHDSRLARDYKMKLAFQGKEGASQVYRFELRAKPDAAVVWDRLVVVVRQADLQPLRQEFFDEEGKKKRELTFAAHAKIGDRVVPRTMRMVDLDKPGEYTLIETKELDFGVSLNKSFFSLQKLKSRR